MKQRGFTLIELIIVLAIVMIVISTVLPILTVGSSAPGTQVQQPQPTTNNDGPRAH